VKKPITKVPNLTAVFSTKAAGERLTLADGKHLWCGQVHDEKQAEDGRLQ
jgi:hypothetical protein